MASNIRQPQTAKPGSDDAVLLELRERWDYATNEWRSIREEARIDMRCVSGDPWDPRERRAREDAMRPVLSLDELGQYVNQLINSVRANKRAIQVTPMGNGATDDTARLRQGLMRQIEYRSNAQQAYTAMFENAVQRSYGYLRVKSRYVDEHGPEQELIIEPIVNPDQVTLDPDALRPDGADMRYLFFTEQLSAREFKREYPKASIQSFDTEAIQAAPDWINENKIRVGEYWTIEEGAEREKLWLRTPNGPMEVWADELNADSSSEYILNRRTLRPKKVMLYKTNGLEILHKEQWCPARTIYVPGPTGGMQPQTLKAATYIPFVPCFGKILWVDKGSGSQRQLLSMIRLARDPYMLYCYYRTCEAELVGMTPKTPFVGYEGQFRGHEVEWQKVAHEPVAFLEAKPQTDATMGQILPLPSRQPYEPPIQSLEIGAESARRAIQSAIGSMPLPTQAQRQNEKSGIALQKIQDTAAQGSFHFIDHYEEAITRTGQLLEELIPHFYDGARDLTVRKADDTTDVVQINQPDAQGQILRTDVGLHDVTLSTGPAKDSERAAANDFANTLVSTPELLNYLPPPARPKLLALAIRLKDVGPLGDEMADIIDPQPKGQPDPQQIAQQAQQLQQQNQELTQKLQQAIQALQTEQVKQDATLKAKQMEITSREKIAEQDRLAKIEIARITAAKQGADLVLEAQEEAIARGEEQTHEIVQNELDRQHEARMSQMASQQAAALASQQGAQQAAQQSQATQQAEGT